MLAGRKPAAAAGHPRQHRRLRRHHAAPSEQRDEPAAPFTQVNMHIHHVQFDTAGVGRRDHRHVVRAVDPPVPDRGPELTAAAAAGRRTPAADERREVPGRRVHRRRPGHRRASRSARSRRSTPTARPSRSTRRSSTPTPRARARAPSSSSTAGIPTSSSTTSSGTTTSTASTAGATAWSASSSSSRKGSTYHDPKTGEQVDSGTIVDIHTQQPAGPRAGDGSFRELALWTIDDNPVTDSTLNLRAEPWADRLADGPGSVAAVLLLTRTATRDTPLPQAYAGDPFVIRTINVGQRRSTPCTSTATASTRRSASGRRRQVRGRRRTDTLHVRHLRALHRRPRGRRRRPEQRGRLPVHERHRPALPPGRLGPASACCRAGLADLQPLPGRRRRGRRPGAADADRRPPAGRRVGAGDPCPAGAPARARSPSAAVDLPTRRRASRPPRAAFVPSAEAADVEAGHASSPSRSCCTSPRATA